jgi:GAF domain-containing protein
MSREVFDRIVAEVEAFARGAQSLQALEEFVVRRIADELATYNWVGFYMLDPLDPQTLVLGPFVGAPTEHARIPVTSGICGAAVAQEQTIVVDDVTADPRYLACSIETRSEIVVPIHAAGHIAGEIDIDSHSPAAFGGEDRAFVERCAEVVGKYIERTGNKGTRERENRERGTRDKGQGNEGTREQGNKGQALSYLLPVTPPISLDRTVS